MRDGLRKLRHAGTHLDSLSLFHFFLPVPLAPFSVCALFSSPSVFLAPMGYGGHRSPVATGGTSGEPQEEYLLLVPRASGSSSDAPTSKEMRVPGRNSANRGRRISDPLYVLDIFYNRSNFFAGIKFNGIEPRSCDFS